MGTGTIASKVGIGKTGGYTQEDKNEYVAAQRDIIDAIDEFSQTIKADQARVLGDGAEIIRTTAHEIQVAAMTKDGDYSYARDTKMNSSLSFAEKVAPCIDIINELSGA